MDGDGSDQEEAPSALQNLLQSKLKKGLKATQTRLTNLDGSQTLLEHCGSQVVSSPQKSASGYGFVVDTKPDLTVGQVFPWLFISSQDVAQDVAHLSRHKISHILSLLPGFQLNSLVKPLVKSHLVLEIFDETTFNLDSQILADALLYIQTCRDKGHNILVHCNAGISRAPSVVILYLMKNQGMSFDSAFQLVKEARPHIQPNQGFLQQLKLMAKTV